MTLAQKERSLSLKFAGLPDDDLLLTSFSGNEEISRLFDFRLEMISDNNAIKADQVIGKTVSFGLKLADDSPRYFHGFVNRFAAGDEDEQGRRNYVADVVPWLWFLTQTADCRIFQGKTVPQIVKKIFSDLGFTDFETSEIKGEHAPWEYCVQYRETDFNFVSRLLEQEGIFYYFKHKKDSHVLVLADQAKAYKDCTEKEVDYPSDWGTRSQEDHITGWEHCYEFHSGKWAQTDYNFETPSARLMAQTNTKTSLANIKKYEVYDYPGEYPDRQIGENQTKLRMEEAEVAHDVVDATSLCKSFTPGGRFKIREHCSKAEEGKTFAITSIQHNATEIMPYETGAGGGEEYANAFQCIPDDVTFRPARATPKPVISGVQTAIVVGPAGEEIYTDEYGRVKAQFHWDREGKKDDKSSCWMRVSQVHSGKGWGGIDIPRIGEEVIVDFLEGDPDRPIITGRVYHAENMPPYALPANKTQSGMKSRSSKGGSGDNFNEIRFEDKMGAEQVYIHAEKNQDNVVENDETTEVGHDRTENVGNDETITIGNNRTESVGVDEVISIGANRTETVGANETVTVAANRTHTVNQNEILTVALTRTHSVGINEMINVGGAQEITVGGLQAVTVGVTRALTVGTSQNTNVGTSHSESIGTDHSEKIGKNHSATVGKNQTAKVGDNRTVNVGKDDTLDVGKNLVIKAGDSITIKTGKASISMKKDGTIVIEGKDITVKGSGAINVKASKNVVIKGKKILEN